MGQHTNDFYVIEVHTHCLKQIYDPKWIQSLMLMKLVHSSPCNIYNALDIVLIENLLCVPQRFSYCVIFNILVVVDIVILHLRFSVGFSKHLKCLFQHQEAQIWRFFRKFWLNYTNRMSHRYTKSFNFIFNLILAATFGECV